MIGYVVEQLAMAPAEAWHPYRLTSQTTRYENERTLPDHVAMLFVTTPHLGKALDRMPRLWLSVDRIISRERLFSPDQEGGRCVLGVTPLFDTRDPRLMTIYQKIVRSPEESILRGNGEDLERLFDMLCAS